MAVVLRAGDLSGVDCDTRRHVQFLEHHFKNRTFETFRWRQRECLDDYDYDSGCVARCSIIASDEFHHTEARDLALGAGSKLLGMPVAAVLALPEVSAVSELVVRRQCHRFIEERTLRFLFRSLTGLNRMVVENWRNRYRVFDDNPISPQSMSFILILHHIWYGFKGEAALFHYEAARLLRGEEPAAGILSIHQSWVCRHRRT